MVEVPPSKLKPQYCQNETKQNMSGLQVWPGRLSKDLLGHAPPRERDVTKLEGGPRGTIAEGVAGAPKILFF
jgi:hypothetical protein